MKLKKSIVRTAIAAALVFGAGVSIAVVAPQHFHKTAAAPAVRLPTIVVRPDANDAAGAQATGLNVDSKNDTTQAAL
jgi:hypothetical protein